MQWNTPLSFNGTSLWFRGVYFSIQKVFCDLSYEAGSSEIVVTAASSAEVASVFWSVGIHEYTEFPMIPALAS